jgi:hypothetical protein
MVFWFTSSVCYLKVFTQRFNRHNSGSHGIVFRWFAEQSVATEPVTETKVTFSYDWKQGKRSCNILNTYNMPIKGVGTKSKYKHLPPFEGKKRSNFQ